MVNFIFSLNIVLSMICLVLSLLVYGVRLVRPELARDQDLLFVTLGLIFSGIIGLHGWRLDPILQFSQIIIVFVVTVVTWENIRLRGVIYDVVTRDKDLFQSKGVNGIYNDKKSSLDSLLEDIFKNFRPRNRK